ncbi:MAG: hypothetical protein ABIL47_00490 [candidate division WOR-3 bacterium]|jgi:predicted nucleotidyltransferase
MESFKEIVNFYKDNIISLYLYGSYAVGDEIEGISDYNLFLILSDYKFSKELSLKYPPFIFTESELLSSIDTFPIEILDIKERGKLLYGRDILKDIEIDKNYLRNQIERELKQKIINFRRALNFENKNLLIFMIMTYKSLTSILRAILHLNNLNKPLKRIFIYYEISKLFDVNYKMFLDIEECLMDKLKNLNSLEPYVFEFYKFLEKLSKKYA